MNDITAGDTKVYTFQRKDYNGETIEDEANSLTFKLYCPKNCSTILTKTLGSGIEFDAATSTYSLTLNPSDTLSLAGRYNFSIRVTTDTYEQTIKRGHLDINPQCGKGVCNG